MNTAPITGYEGCDDILRWLDAHAVSIRLGIPAQQLHRRWAEAGRQPGDLSRHLEYLFSQGLVAVTREAETVHLRFTPAGFSLMGQHGEAARAAASAHQAPASAEVSLVHLQPAAPPSAEYARLTEIRARHDILSIYQDLRLRSEALLISMTLSRYWQEMGNRGGDLRSALDVVLRDGLLKPRLIGIDRYWMLTESGFAWMQAAPTPECLWRLSPLMAAPRRSGASAAEVQFLTAQVLMQAGGHRVSYQRTLAPKWPRQSRLDDNALLLGLDLLHKHDFATIQDLGDDIELDLTATGEAFANGRIAGVPRAIRERQ